MSKAFRIYGKVDGRWREVSIEAKGGFVLAIDQRDGNSWHPVPMRICGYVADDGELTLTIEHGVTRFKKTTRAGEGGE